MCAYWRVKCTRHDVPYKRTDTKNLSYILIRKRAEEWSAAGINQYPAAQLREPECNGGRQLVPLARRMPPEQRSATSLPDVADRAPERMQPVTSHRCPPGACRRGMEGTRVSRTRLPVLSVQLRPHTRTRAESKTLRQSRRRSDKAPT